MTNEVRLATIQKDFADYLLGGTNGCKKATGDLKGWIMQLNPEHPNYAALVVANGGKDVINEKGLLECLTVLRKIVKATQTAATPVEKPVKTAKPAKAEKAVEPTAPAVEPQAEAAATVVAPKVEQPVEAAKPQVRTRPIRK